MAKLNRWSLLVCYCFLFFVFAITVAGRKWQKHTVLKSDAAGYYAYLPAIFIYNDLFSFEHYPQIDSLYNPGDGVVYYAVQRYPATGKFYLKYNWGVSAFELPPFLLAHTFALLSGIYPADGYSAPYQFMIAISAVLYSFLALLLIRRLLLYWFADGVVAVVLLIIAFGTNYLAQVITQPGLSHVYMFFLYSLILYSAQQFTIARGSCALFCLITGMAMVPLTRASGIFVVVLPLFWKVGDKYFLKELASHIKSKPFLSGVICITGLMLISCQLIYWHQATGHWLFYTYRREYFDFANSHIIDGLFSYRKGWFVYTPLALLGFAGMVALWYNKQMRFYLLPVLLYFCVTIYIVFSWWQWYYGGSFGCRVMVESLAILAIPIAALLSWVNNKKTWQKVAFGAVISLGILLNLFQTYQYGKGIIHWQKMSKEYYWRVFGKLSVTDADRDLLNNTEELDTNNSPYN